MLLVALFVAAFGKMQINVSMFKALIIFQVLDSIQFNGILFAGTILK